MLLPQENSRENRNSNFFNYPGAMAVYKQNISVVLDNGYYKLY